MEKSRALILFTRVPVAGWTKTRLSPYLAPAQCAKLHTCFLKDIAVVCEGIDADIFVCYTDILNQACSQVEDASRDGSGILRRIFGKKARYFSQEDDCLGERMYRAIEKVLEAGYRSCVLMGTDVPEVRGADIEQAFHMLEGADASEAWSVGVKQIFHGNEAKDVVFGPTADGGYYLVGMKVARWEAFEGQTYGHGSVLCNTARRLKKAGLSVGLGKCRHDIDTQEDIEGYRDRMRSRKELWKTHTGRYLAQTAKVSIIVPIYNEEKTVGKLLDTLGALKDRCEILLVDGGSTDRTLQKIAQKGVGFRLLHAKKGRAGQMNLGARESTGDILFFLHCDSELPQRPLEQIRAVMRDYRVGCFGIAFHSRNFFMLTCRVISNHRIKDRNVVFGDQGIFIDRRLFFDVGMFPELPIMEDYQFSLYLKERGERIGITKRRIYTSDRRFPRGTTAKLREMWKMNRMRKMYRDGVDASKLAAMYADVR